MIGKRKFKIMLFPNPERKVMAFEVKADTIDIDPRGNAIFKVDGRIVGIVSNPAYQFVKEIVEVTVISK
jgi:hypothetical protein